MHVLLALECLSKSVSELRCGPAVSSVAECLAHPKDSLVNPSSPAPAAATVALRAGDVN